MKGLLKKTGMGVAALAFGLVVGLAVDHAVHAQVPPGTVQVQTTATPAQTGLIWGQGNGATSCNTVSETAAQDTITITPPAGMSAYITGLYIENSSDATGVTQVPTISTTGLSFTGGLAPFFSVASALSTTGMTGGVQAYVFNPPLKGAGSTSVTFVPSATQSAHNYLCMQAVGYFAN